MTEIDQFKPCHYSDAHPPHLWAFQAPSGAPMVAGCPGVVVEFHYNDEPISAREQQWAERFGTS